MGSSVSLAWEAASAFPKLHCATGTTWESCYTVTDPDSDVWDGV